ncbi:MAG: nickel-dependent hydrogenase large subunit [Deltaproteobacteria bacterium]|nr:nickel-dependent hydrogenase large subunit [Deltaproteobacteria bacterium]
MSVTPLNRVEGGCSLSATSDGIRLQGPPPRLFEHRLVGRTALEAVFLTQQISADMSISHALAAVNAWEMIARINVAENGRVLREFLHALSIIHAHLRNFYLVTLPDYLPPGTLADYTGGDSEVKRISAEVRQKPPQHWSRHMFPHPFSPSEVNRLWEQSLHAPRYLSLLQRMMALLGGKFPQVMCMVPGGVTLNLTEALLIKMRVWMVEMRHFIGKGLMEDGLLVVNRYPHIKTLGRGVRDFLSVGSGEDDAVFESSIFPSGIYTGGRLERFTPVGTESIVTAFYRLAQPPPSKGPVLLPDPEKRGAYSWIKAPRHQGQPMECGPFARMIIAYLSGARIADPTLVETLQRETGLPLNEGNTTGGRLLARLAETTELFARCGVLLDQLDPAQPTILHELNPHKATGEALGHVEGPAGSVRHHVTLEKGQVLYYDIYSASTWNGSSRDENGRMGSLESALNAKPLDPAKPEDLRDLARIARSFAFSMSDATH